jgi:peroxiredoxin
MRTRQSRIGRGLGLVLAAFAISAGEGRAQAQAPATPTPVAMPSAPTPPAVGDTAADFTLRALDGSTLRLSDELTRGPLVLVVLRGWPGYQCPFCTRQFGDYLRHAERFGQAGARVLFVYPGPADGLAQHAEAFTGGKPMPAAFRILIDPDYGFTNAYGVRWAVPSETAYPSTFVIDAQRNIAFAKISREHGDRVTAETVLEVLVRLRR